MWDIDQSSHEIAAENIDLPRKDQQTSSNIQSTDVHWPGAVGRVGRAQCTQGKVAGSNPDSVKGILSKVILLFPNHTWLHSMAILHAI